MRYRPASFPCCRDHDLYEPLEEYAQSIKRSLADEVYYFRWQSSFDGNATIRIARQARRVAVFRVYRPERFDRARLCRRWLPHADWERLEDALVEAQFWLLDENGGHEAVLDGATWMFAGRRGPDYHCISRRCPSLPVRDLGRCIFDLAGLEDVRL